MKNSAKKYLFSLVTVMLLSAGFARAAERFDYLASSDETTVQEVGPELVEFDLPCKTEIVDR